MWLGVIEMSLLMGMRRMKIPVRRVFFLPGPLQTVQRAELWRAILYLQAFVPVFYGHRQPETYSISFQNCSMDQSG